MARSEELSVAVKALAKDMMANIPSLKKVNEHWPDPKDTLEMPCVSILVVGTPRLTKNPPTLQKAEDDPENALKVNSLYLAGQYEITLQVDLWCEYKQQRDTFYQLIADYFDRQMISGERDMPGLVLELTDYYPDVFACFDNVSYNFSEQEESSQRSEWRVRFEVLVVHPRMIEKSEFRMAEITLKSEISDEKPIDETAQIDIRESTIVT